MDKISVTIDGVEIRATGENVNNALKLINELVNGKNYVPDFDIQIRLEYILHGKIPAIKLHRALVNEQTGETPSLVDSKNHVERVCGDIQNLHHAGLTIDSLRQTVSDQQVEIQNLYRRLRDEQAEVSRLNDYIRDQDR